jgi:DNA-binding CsgD family transcriptional regulator
VKIDCIRIIEAGYAPAATDAEWMSGVLEPFEPLARGMGEMARIVDFGGASPTVGSPVSRGPVPPLLESGLSRMFTFLASSHPDVLRALLDPVPRVVCWASHRGAVIPDQVLMGVREILAGSGFRDALGILSADPSGPSLVVTVPYGEEVAIPARTVRQITRATAHLCSALRLRRRSSPAPSLPRSGGLSSDVEAVLDPSGRVHHATGAAEGKPARQSLTEAVRQVERARGSLRRTDPDEAMAIWSALFQGRWSIVDRTESDGRRFLLARRNPPGPPDPKALTQGERDVLACVARGHSNKYAGFLLGVAPSTVSTRLESALRKLGIATRREAIEMLGGGAPSA